MLATLAAPAARALPSSDSVTEAQAAVLRILGDRASSLGFSNVEQRPFAVCGRVHVRNAGEGGPLPFVYSLVSLQAHVLDPVAHPQGVRAAIIKLRMYCT